MTEVPSLQSLALKKIVLSRNIAKIPIHVIKTALLQSDKLRIPDSDLALFLSGLIEQLPNDEYKVIDSLVIDLLTKLPQKMLYVMKNSPQNSLLEQIMKIPLHTTYTKDEVVSIFKYLHTIYPKNINYKESMTLLKNVQCNNFVLRDVPENSAFIGSLSLTLFRTNILLKDTHPNGEKIVAINDFSFTDYTCELPGGNLFGLLSSMSEDDKKVIMNSRHKPNIDWKF